MTSAVRSRGNGKRHRRRKTELDDLEEVTQISTVVKRSDKAILAPIGSTNQRRSGRAAGPLSRDLLASQRVATMLMELHSENLMNDPRPEGDSKMPDFGFRQTAVKTKASRATKRWLGTTSGRYKKTFEQRRQDYALGGGLYPALYDQVRAPPPTHYQNKMCETCSFESSFSCKFCLARLCSKACLNTHQDLRCNKPIV